MREMTDEVKAAAERLIGNWYDAYRCTGEGVSGECLGDIENVARAYLALTAADEGDDGEAVTKNDPWLKEIGFDYDDEADDWHRCGLYLKWLVVGWRCQIEGRDNLWATFGGENVTRGDVRHLCKILRVNLLGIDLPPPKGE